MEAWIALAGSIFGGLGLKVVEYFVSRSRMKVDASKVEVDAATEIREELRSEISNLRKEIDKLEDQLENWKQRYYTLLERFNEMKIKYGITDYPFKEDDSKDD